MAVTHKDQVTQHRQAMGIKKTATHLRRRERRERASVRQGTAVRDPQLQLGVLDTRLGVGVGAVRERARLKQRLKKNEAKAKDETKKQNKE